MDSSGTCQCGDRALTYACAISIRCAQYVLQSRSRRCATEPAPTERVPSQSGSRTCRRSHDSSGYLLVCSARCVARSRCPSRGSRRRAANPSVGENGNVSQLAALPVGMPPRLCAYWPRAHPFWISARLGLSPAWARSLVTDPRAGGISR